MMESVMNKCGGCKFAKMIPQDMTRRLCYGVPPQTMMTPKGVASVRALVSVSDEGCALYAPRIMQAGAQAQLDAVQ